MTVRLEGSIKRFVGLSSDAKPRPYRLGGDMAEGELLPAGSVFYEEDTGKTARWDGSDWRYLPDLAEMMSGVRAATDAALVKLDGIAALLATNKAE